MVFVSIAVLVLNFFLRVGYPFNWVFSWQLSPNLVSPLNLIRLFSHFFSTKFVNLFLPGCHFEMNAVLWNIRFIDPALLTQHHQTSSRHLQNKLATWWNAVIGATSTLLKQYYGYLKYYHKYRWLSCFGGRAKGVLRRALTYLYVRDISYLLEETLFLLRGFSLVTILQASVSEFDSYLCLYMFYLTTILYQRSIFKSS